MSFIDSFIQGGFHGQIAIDFMLIISAMLVFTLVNSKFALRLWTETKGKKFDVQRIVNYTGIIFPAAFVFYALFGLDLNIPCMGPVCLFDYKGGGLLFHNFNYAILARVFSTVNGGHVLCWIGILTAYFSIMYMEKKSEFHAGKALLSALGLIALSEFHWNMFYLVYLVFVTHSFEMVTLGGFVISQLWLVTVIMIWFYYYRNFLLKMLPIILPVTFVFFAGWFSIGFPITLTSNATTDPNIITQWYSNLTVNGIEIGSWETISTVCIIAYYMVKHSIGQKLETRIAVSVERRLREITR